MRGSDNVDLPTLVLHKFLSCYLAVFVHIHMIQNRYIHGKYLELSGILIMASYTGFVLYQKSTVNEALLGQIPFPTNLTKYANQLTDEIGDDARS